MTLKVLSLNAWGGKLHADLIPYLRNADADVLCLQEVTKTAQAASDWLFYRDQGTELPQRANLFDEIKAALPDHEAIFCPVSRGILYDGERPVWSEFGLATFVHKRLAIITQCVDFVHGAFSADGWAEHPRPRNAHCLRIFSYEHGFSSTIVQMHGLRDVAGKGDTPARRAQAVALVRLIERIWPGDEPLVVCGDLNLLPDSETFEILRGLGLADLVTERGFTDTRTSHYGKAGRYADYMLVTPHVKIAAFDVIEQPEVSDHRAMMLQFG